MFERRRSIMKFLILLGIFSAALAGYGDGSLDHNQEAEKYRQEFDRDRKPYYLQEETFPFRLDSDEQAALDYSLWNEYGAHSYGGKGGKSSKKGKRGGKGGKGWGRRK